MPLVDTCDWQGAQGVESIGQPSCWTAVAHACARSPRASALALTNLCLPNVCLSPPLPVLFFHPVCMADYQVKTGLMKRQGVWFMDEDSESSAPSALPLWCMQHVCWVRARRLWHIARCSLPAYGTHRLTASALCCPANLVVPPILVAFGVLPTNWCAFAPDASGCHANTTWAACQPLRWQQPALERHLYACPEYHLALVHQRPQREQERPAVQEVDVAVVWGS